MIPDEVVLLEGGAAPLIRAVDCTKGVPIAIGDEFCFCHPLPGVEVM